MVPEFIDSSSWAGIARLLTSLWGFAFSWVTFALSMLLAQGIIPSLVTSHHIPARFQSVRPIFYIVSLVGFMGALFFMYNAIAHLSFIYGIWDRRAI
ncbi:MAG: hypothetical protein HW403_21 [Dehalococcoidia bacterium]|nr:hypothetical protein [Dehalococcoidia bacterium]